MKSEMALSKKKTNKVQKRVLRSWTGIIPKPVRTNAENKNNREEMCEFTVNLELKGYLQRVQKDINSNAACDSVRQDVFNMAIAKGGNLMEHIKTFNEHHEAEQCAFVKFKKLCLKGSGGYFCFQCGPGRDWLRVCAVCKSASFAYEKKRASLYEFCKGHVNNNSEMSNDDMELIGRQTYFKDF